MKAILCLGEESKKQKERSREQTEELGLCLVLKTHKTQVSEQGRLRNLKFKPFQVSIIKISMVDTLKKVHKSGRNLK